MRHTHTQTKPCWQTNTVASKYPFKQLFNITVLTTTALLMMTASAFGLNLEGNASFGQINNQVTVTVKGKLDLKTELPGSTQRICMVDRSTSPAVNVTITAANNYSTCQYNSMRTSALKQNWHFVLFTITSISGSATTDTTTTTILLPTALIRENEFYEMALYDKRHVQIKWATATSSIPEEFIAQGAENIKEDVEVKVSKIRIDGLFSKQEIL